MANPRCLAYEDSNDGKDDKLGGLTPPVYIHTEGVQGLYKVGLSEKETSGLYSCRPRIEKSHPDTVDNLQLDLVWPIQPDPYCQDRVFNKIFIEKSTILSDQYRKILLTGRQILDTEIQKY